MDTTTFFAGLADKQRLIHNHAGLMPMIPQLNVAVMVMANATNPQGWNVVAGYADAPHSLDDLNESISRTGKITVWAGGSEETIFGCPEHNYAFRAWHDAVHYDLQAPFTLAGEAATAYLQIGQLVRRYGGDGEVIEWAARLLSEVIGQAMHNIQTGEFPEDQIEFSIKDTPNWLRLANVIVGAFDTLDRPATKEELQAAMKATAIRMSAEAFGAF